MSFPEFDSVEVEFSAQKAVGNVTLDTVYLSPAGDVPPDMLAFITVQVAKMQEIYRQIGIRVAWASIDGNTISQTMLNAVPNPDPTKPDLEAANLLNDSESQSVRTQIRGRTVPDKHVRIGYVDATMQLLQNFIPVDVLGFTGPGTDGIVVSLGSAQARATLGVTAHEVGHAFGLDHVAPEHLLMKSEMIWLNGKRDPKRFEEGNYNTMKNKEAFYVPFQ